MPEREEEPYYVERTVYRNRSRLDADHRYYADPSYDRQPAAVPAARAGMSGGAIAAIAIAFVVSVMAFTANWNYTFCTTPICVKVAEGQLAADKDIREAKIKADEYIRVANAANEPARIKADVDKTVAQHDASVLIARANAGTNDRVRVIDRLTANDVRQVRYVVGDTDLRYINPPAAVRTSFHDLPSAREIYNRVEHKVTRRYAPCVAGYDQDPVSGDCTRTRWVAGPMPQ